MLRVAYLLDGVHLRVCHSSSFAVLLIGSYAHGSLPRWSGRGSSHYGLEHKPYCLYHPIKLAAAGLEWVRDYRTCCTGNSGSGHVLGRLVHSAPFSNVGVGDQFFICFYKVSFLQQ